MPPEKFTPANKVADAMSKTKSTVENFFILPLCDTMAINSLKRGYFKECRVLCIKNRKSV